MGVRDLVSLAFAGDGFIVGGLIVWICNVVVVEAVTAVWSVVGGLVVIVGSGFIWSVCSIMCAVVGVKREPYLFLAQPMAM